MQFLITPLVSSNSSYCLPNNVRVMIYFTYYFIRHHFDCITQSICYLTNSHETSPDEQEDGTDHHDHGKPKEKPQSQDWIL